LESTLSSLASPTCTSMPPMASGDDDHFSDKKHTDTSEAFIRCNTRLVSKVTVLFAVTGRCALTVRVVNRVPGWARRLYCTSAPQTYKEVIATLPVQRRF
jgi:hypothetical protein